MSKNVYIKKVDEFFKHDKYVSLVKDYKIMEFTVDLVIGTNVFIDFAKGTPKEVMQKILLANSYDSSRNMLQGTNDYKQVELDEHDYGNFIIYDSYCGLFIKVFDKNDLSWIPLVYEYYAECPEFLMEEPGTCELKDSSELIQCGYCL